MQKLYYLRHGFGRVVSGIMIGRFFKVDGKFDWPGIWLSCAAYAAIVAVLFRLLFKRPQNEALEASLT